MQELAERVRLSASATRERLKRLESSGVVRGYSARVDEQMLGFRVDALVEVDLAPGADDARLTKALDAMPAVVEVLHATGDHDYLLRLKCRDTDELHAVVRSLRAEHGAARTRTRVVLHETIARRPRLQ
jgi:Lrp/AsnC family leucine-responsive transcriptional regulator